MSIKVIGTGSYLPRTIVTNDFFGEKFGKDYAADLKGLSNGCKIRRHACDDETAIYMGTESAKIALESAKLNPSEIDWVLGYSVAADNYAPSDIAVIMENLQIKNAIHWTMDVGCASFIPMLQTADMLAKSKKARRILLVNNSAWVNRILNHEEDYNSLGDASAAVVVEADTQDSLLSCHEMYFPELTHQLKVALHWRTKQQEYVVFNRESSGRKMFVDGTIVTPARQCVLEARQKGIDIDWCILSQVGKNMMDVWMQNLELDGKKLLSTQEFTGHLSAANIPFVLDYYTRIDKRIKRGDTILAFSPGSGGYAGSFLYRY